MSIEATEYVLKNLAATYGAEWDRSMGTAPLSDVKTVWAEAIGGFTQSTDAKRAILWALDNLPERCPNAIQFRNLCRQAPAVVKTALEAPKADPARVAEAMARMAPLMAAKPATRTDHKAWARRILERKDAGEIINPTSLQMARNAVNVEEEIL